jgi:predicted transcriptional regulator
VLEDAGLIRTSLRSAARGNEKVCAGIYQRLDFLFRPELTDAARSSQVSMPIGGYSDYHVVAPCGLATAHKIIGMQGEESAFLEPERLEAQLIWFTDGWLEYRFPRRLPPKAVATGLYLSMEVCSEAPHYNNEFPSDITVWVNGCELGTWTSPGDFGGKRGVLTPEWWATDGSQFGLLKTWSVNHVESAIDGQHLSGITLADLAIDATPAITVRIGIKPDARHKGGMNLFGKQFGNYPQDIVLRLAYDYVE